MDASDSRVISLVENNGRGCYSLGDLSPDMLKEYQGKVLAILVETGQVIFHAKTAEQLQEMVRGSKYNGQDWRLVDGPTGEKPMTVEELKASLS
jgi:hypothetical protein